MDHTEYIRQAAGDLTRYNRLNFQIYCKGKPSLTPEEIRWFDETEKSILYGLAICIASNNGCNQAARSLRETYLGRGMMSANTASELRFDMGASQASLISLDQAPVMLADDGRNTA